MFIGKHFVCNGDFSPCVQSPNLNPSDIYEVIRLVDGKPLFWDAHFNRFKQSHTLAQKDFNYSSQFLLQIIETISLKEQKNIGNILIAIRTTPSTQLFCGFIKHYYPSPEELEQGVQVHVIQWERDRPNIKHDSTARKTFIRNYMEQHGVFEVLLENKNGLITEGSRTNIFFYSNQCIYTTPGTSVLEGITRKEVIRIIHNNSLKYNELLPSKRFLEQCEWVALTGTSIGILPVSQIESKHFSTNHPTLRMLQSLYEKAVKMDLKTS